MKTKEQILEMIETFETRMLFADEKSFCDFCKIQNKINEVIK